MPLPLHVSIPLTPSRIIGLIHGDGFLDNTIYDEASKQLIGLVDWEVSLTTLIAALTQAPTLI